jgi:5-methylcytosine-specific restriction endonuclease McrA
VNYEEYLRSPKWRRKRKDRLQIDGHACQKCGATSKQYRLEVHHLTYERLSDERMEDLQTLCVLCHPFETSEQRRKKYANRVFVLSDFERKTPIASNEEGHDGLQNVELQDYRRRTPPYA